jgi:hypothetical protein
VDAGAFLLLRATLVLPLRLFDFATLRLLDLFVFLLLLLLVLFVEVVRRFFAKTSSGVSAIELNISPNINKNFVLSAC